jgi:hypothetical protein
MIQLELLEANAKTDAGGSEADAMPTKPPDEERSPEAQC